VRSLDRKLLRDLWSLKTQVVSIALVIACGIGGFIGSLSTYSSLVWSRAHYYDTARFAHVFATAKRAPGSLATTPKPSARNLLFMRSFAEACPDAEKVKQLVSQLPWGHVIRLLQRVKEPEVREWYIRESIEHGWSRSILELQIDGRAHERHGKALTNFKATLPPADSDMAAQVFKDPYLFDFLGTADPRREREVEQALVDHIQRFLLELGSGFAFVGRQVQLAFASRDYFLDLLFYHLKLRCYVVIELKAVPFDPAFIGQINVYLSAVDDLLRHPGDKPTIGLLLCRSKDKIVVEYALRDLKKPIGVAGWETKIVEKLPENLKGSLPTVEEIEAELSREESER